MAQGRPFATAGAAHSIAGGNRRTPPAPRARSRSNAACRRTRTALGLRGLRGRRQRHAGRSAWSCWTRPNTRAASYSDDSPNLVQINVHGRILQVAFAATAELVSTEDFRIPYILEGSVRAFNQEMLDKDLIEEQPLFYTMERGHNMWRYFRNAHIPFRPVRPRLPDLGDGADCLRVSLAALNARRSRDRQGAAGRGCC